MEVSFTELGGGDKKGKWHSPTSCGHFWTCAILNSIFSGGLLSARLTCCLALANRLPCISQSSLALTSVVNLKVNLMKVLVARSCPTLCDPMDCSDPMDCRTLGFSVHGILQARILVWVAISSSRVSSQPRDQTLQILNRLNHQRSTPAYPSRMPFAAWDPCRVVWSSGNRDLELVQILALLLLLLAVRTFDW